MIEQSEKLQFIIIDDSKIDLFLICKILTSVWPDSEVVKFENPIESLNFVKGNSIEKAVIFLDIQMPVMNGFQWLDEFAKFSDNTKSCYTIYILTSSSNPSDLHRGRSNIHVKDVLTKPLNKEILLNLPL
jgi:CheY-like chemotaxis protein